MLKIVADAMTEADYIANIRTLWPEQEADAAEPLRIAEEGIRAFPASTKLLCMRGDLIQLSDGGNYSLADALVSYERAIALDHGCAEAHESVGYFFDVIEIDLNRAEAAFRRAIDLGAGADSHVGLARVLAEQGQSTQAIIELLDACPYAAATAVRKMRLEIESGCWKPK